LRPAPREARCPGGAHRDDGTVPPAPRAGDPGRRVRPPARRPAGLRPRPVAPLVGRRVGLNTARRPPRRGFPDAHCFPIPLSPTFPSPGALVVSGRADRWYLLPGGRGSPRALRLGSRQGPAPPT